jgi:uncharacterized protein YneR
MRIYLSNEAAKWYKTEMNLTTGDKVRFFVRYGGYSTIHRGFSLGVELAEPFEIGSETRAEDILFFIEEKDIWYFEEYDLHISFNKLLDEPVFEYVKRSLL